MGGAVVGGAVVGGAVVGALVVGGAAGVGAGAVVGGWVGGGSVAGGSVTGGSVVDVRRRLGRSEPPSPSPSPEPSEPSEPSEPADVSGRTGRRMDSSASSGWPSSRSAGGGSNVPVSVPAVAATMKRRHISAGRFPPLTVRPWTLDISGTPLLSPG